MFKKTKNKEIALTSNIDLEKLCAIFSINLVAVLAKDELKKYTPVEGGYIINIGNLNTGGTHWVCFIIDESYIVYFDSFGVRPPDDVKRFIYRFNFKSHVNGIIYSTQQIQGLKSNLCGYYCIYCLWYFTVLHRDNNDYKKLINGHSKLYSLVKLKLNDKILQKLFSNLII